MNYFNDFLKSYQERINLFNHSFMAMNESIRNQNETLKRVIGATNISEVIKSSIQQKNNLKFSQGIENPLKRFLEEQYKVKRSLTGFNSIYSVINQNHKQLADSLLTFNSSQTIISEQLKKLSKTYSDSYQDTFKSLEIAIRGISTNYLKDIINNQSWNEIEFVHQSSGTVAAVTEELINRDEIITIEDFENFKISLINNLNLLLTKTKSAKAKEYIFQIITIISFILSFYNSYIQTKDNTNKEIINEINELKVDINNFKEELSLEFSTFMTKFYKTRVARTNVNLRYYPKKNSKIIGLVKQGQEVTVIEIRHKYILITYIDYESNEPKSGFVYKKYFEIK